MYLRIDKLAIELPMPQEPNPKAASAVQELLGGRFGEMSTLMNYTFQSFNMRGREKIKPYYDLVANIATEELGHIELVSATINSLLTGATQQGEPQSTPMANGLNGPNYHHFIAAGHSALPVNSMNMPWSGENVFSSGDLTLDLLHNFFLECGARQHKIRVYEMTDHPVARALIGYLLVRGGLHIVAYGKALESLTGVPINNMLPVPAIPNSKFPETQQYEANGNHRTLYRYSIDDYKDIDKIWTGTHPEDGQPVQVVDGPPEGAPAPLLPEEPQTGAPSFDPELLASISKRVMGGL